jgi:hypothetical protein
MPPIVFKIQEDPPKTKGYLKKKGKRCVCVCECECECECECGCECECARDCFCDVSAYEAVTASICVSLCV